MPQGILLFAHGARDPAWARPFEQARDQIQASQADATDTVHVRLAFLEFMAPNLIEAGHELVRLGCSQVTVVPLFLGAGGHVRKDLPLLVAQLMEAHPQTGWQLAPAVGETDVVVNALAEAATQLAGLPR